jgi:hypothetical protein
MRPFCCAASIVVLLAALSPEVRCQEPDTLSAPQRVGLALARLGAGQQVRVHSRHFGLTVGRIVADTGKILTLDTGGGTRAGLLTSDVDSLWTRGGGHAGTGALIGAAVGGLALGAGGVALGKANCEGGYSCGDARDFVAGLVLGSALGAGIGALIGSLVPKWHLAGRE